MPRPKNNVNRTSGGLAFLQSAMTLGIAVPVPGRDFYKYVEENNYLSTKDWSLYDPMKKPVFSYPQLTSDEISYYSRQGLRKFYLRPKYIASRLKLIRSVAEAEAYFRNFIGFIKRYVIKRKNV